MGTATYKRSPGPQLSTNLGLETRHPAAVISCVGTCSEFQYACAAAEDASEGLLSWICRATLSNSAVHAPSVKKGGINASQTNAITSIGRIMGSNSLSATIARESYPPGRIRKCAHRQSSSCVCARDANLQPHRRSWPWLDAAAMDRGSRTC